MWPQRLYNRSGPKDDIPPQPMVTLHGGSVNADTSIGLTDNTINRAMRLTPSQVDIIKSTARAILGDGAQITLFGSRVHDEQRGGDVDLYIEATQADLMQKIHCKVSLQDQLDMPVDLIVKPFGDSSPIALIAKQEGVRL